MDKNKLLMVTLSLLTILALGLGITAFGQGKFYPPGGSVVP